MGIHGSSSNFIQFSGCYPNSWFQSAHLWASQSRYPGHQMHDISDFVACPTVSSADQPTCCIVFWWCKLNFWSGIPIYDSCIRKNIHLLHGQFVCSFLNIKLISSQCLMTPSWVKQQHHSPASERSRHLRSHGSSSEPSNTRGGCESWAYYTDIVDE